MRGAAGPTLALAALATALSACGDLQGLGGPAPALVSFQVQPTGDLTPLRPAGTSDVSLQVALVWGAEWQPEPFCVLPAQSSDAAAVIAAGCRDPFGFVPARAAQSVAVTIDAPAALQLANLPAADLLVGGVTSRVSYASLVFYDDRDGSGTLDLSMPHPTATRDDGPPEDDTPDSTDVIYGASFFTMTAPDQRVAFLEGTFTPSAYYPRSGCADPPDGFSILSAGGFSQAAGLTAAAQGLLPAEDPAACATASPDSTVVPIAAQALAVVGEVGCSERALDGFTRYRSPPADAPDFTGRTVACAPLPTFGSGTEPDLTQFIVSGRATDRCKGLTHYTLRGCREDVACAVPDWDYTSNPPAWWPCATP